MSAVGIEESTAVRAEYLDGFLRRDRPLGNHLVGDGLGCRLAVGAGGLDRVRIQELCSVVRLQILHDALGNEYQRDHQAYGKQDPQNAAREVYPEVPDRLGLPPRD